MKYGSAPVRSHYPVVKSKVDARDWSFSKISTPVSTLPHSVNMIHLCPPVVDQGNLGSCTGNAIAGAYEFDMMKEKITPIVPSRLFIYYNERVLEGTVNQDAGAEIRDGIKAIANNGVCAEALWPYDVTKFAIKPSAEAYAAAQQHKALNYYSVNLDLQSIKQALAQGYPIVAGIQVYASFESNSVARNGLVPMPGPNEACLGGHCIMIVGYADASHHLICRNSWGTNWGDHGYFYLPYAYVDPNLMDELWVVKAVK